MAGMEKAGVLTHSATDPFRVQMLVQDPRQVLFMWVFSVNIYYMTVKTEKFLIC